MQSKRIQKLSLALSNQIAAGEVIERPASVLKELLENSLDANCNQIHITIEKGGLSLIRVQDNGHGICKEDLELAICPHATSKIQTLEDLEAISSFGFRGEALASISAVSKLSLSSWVETQELGYCIQSQGRNFLPEIKPVPPAVGTLIEVRNLFYNTPARLKFLKSEKTELTYLEEVFKRIALSKPAVALSLKIGEGKQKQLSICRSFDAQEKRLRTLCGNHFIENAYFIDSESNGLKLTGWLGSTETLRAQSDLQYFYVNARIIRDKIINHAIRQAYQLFCPKGKYPAYVLYFELDPTAVDVNVHPTKHEVRFREARIVHAFLSYSVQKGLQRTKNIFVASDVENKTELVENIGIKVPISIEKKKQYSFGNPIAVLANEILISENEQGLVIVDIIMAKTFIAKKLLTESYSKGVAMKPLLIPKIIKVNHWASQLDSFAFNWIQLGFELDQISPDSIIIRRIPELFDGSIDCLEQLFFTLIKSISVSEAIQILASFIGKKTNNMFFDNKKLLEKLEDQIADLEQEKIKLYRKVSIEELRSILM